MGWVVPSLLAIIDSDDPLLLVRAVYLKIVCTVGGSSVEYPRRRAISNMRTLRVLCLLTWVEGHASGWWLVVAGVVSQSCKLE